MTRYFQDIIFRICLRHLDNLFQVLNERSKVACGFVIVTSDPLNQINHAIGDDRIVLNSEDIYKMFSEREYSYRSV